MSAQKLPITESKDKTCRQLRYEYQNPKALGEALDELAETIENKIEQNCGSYDNVCDLDRDTVLRTKLNNDPDVIKYDNLQDAIHSCLFEQADRETALIAGLGAGVPAATIGGGGLAVIAPMVWPSLKSFFKSIFK